MFKLVLAQGHGFRSDLINMIIDLKPAFLRFPGMQKLKLKTLKHFIIFFLHDVCLFSKFPL